MRSRLIVAVAAASLTLAAVPSGASAQVAGENQGVTAVRGPHGVVLRFGPRAASVYRRIAGRRVRVACSTLAKPGFGPSIEGGSEQVLRAPRRRGPIRTGDRSRLDYCSVRLQRGSELVALAPVTARGRTYIDEFLTSALPDLPFELGEPNAGTPPSVAQLVARGHGLIVALDGPDGSPPPGKIGYWTDGRRAVAAALSHAGRRLFLDTDGDVVRTNVMQYYLDVEDI